MESTTSPASANNSTPTIEENHTTSSAIVETEFADVNAAIDAEIDITSEESSCQNFDRMTDNGLLVEHQTLLTIVVYASAPTESTKDTQKSEIIRV